MASSAPLVLKWNDANTISVNKPGTDSSINFVNDGSARKIGAYYTDSGASRTSFELSHGTQSQFIINRADGVTAALYFETDVGTTASNQLKIYNNAGSDAFKFSTNVGPDTTNQLIIWNAYRESALEFFTNVGNRKSNIFIIKNADGFGMFNFITNEETSNTNVFSIYNANGSDTFKFQTDVGDNRSSQLFVYNSQVSTAFEFSTDVGTNRFNTFTIYNSETVASTKLTTNITIDNTGIVLPLKFQSADTTVPTGTNTEGICVFDSESLTATSTDATKTAMLKRTVPSTYAVQQALGSIVSLNIAPFELEATTDAQGKGLLFRIKLPAEYSATGADQYYNFDFSAKTHGYNP